MEIQIVSSQHLFFFPKRGENMIKPTEFVNYVDRLPDDCVESMTDGEVHFHLPHPGMSPAPFAAHPISAYINIAHKCCVESRGRLRDTFTIDDAIVATIAGKTFVEESPFLASFQRRIGNRLRQIRARKKLSQREVIESIGFRFICMSNMRMM